MKSTSSKAVYEAVSSTFENLAFLEISPTDARLDSSADVMRATVVRQGAEKGGLSLFLPRTLVEELARNSLGDLEITEETLCDVLGETCNVVAGIIGAMECKTMLLSAPEINKDDSTPSSDHANHYLQCMDHCFVVSLW